MNNDNMTKNKATWINLPPSEQVQDVAAFIAKEYFRLSSGSAPSEEKINYLLYLCVRDTFQVTGRPILEEHFEIFNVNQVRIHGGQPPVHTLLRTEPYIADSSIADTIRRVLPNYAGQATWKLRGLLVESLCHLLGRVPSRDEALGAVYTVSTEDLWKDGLRIRPYDYYSEAYFDER